ncbi:MAG: transglycosylase domain-containing protein, partial [Patescibacteria group bacterium]
ILRAFIRNLIFRSSEGGSTLTQQLVKNTLLSSEKTIWRKIKEFILAVEVERRYSKDQIIEMYLNQIPYGGTTYGIESAARYYFGKPAKELSVIEGAILSGLPQSPSIYSPIFGVKDAYINRTKAVLRRMREDGYISKAKEALYLKQLPTVTFKKKSDFLTGGHFVFYVENILKNLVGEDLLFKKGLVIKTTLDLDLQREAEKIVREEIKKAKGLSISNGAVVIMSPKDGSILAMVGSVDYNNDKFGKFNAALGLRQPGSTLKPFTYAVALEKGLTAGSMTMDVPTEFSTGIKTGSEELDKPYIPVNYDGKYRGPVQLRFSLGSSLNVTAVKTIAMVGLQPFLQKVYDAGLTTLAPTEQNMKRFGLSITLGGGEVRLVDLVSAYASLASGGKSVNSRAVTEVRDYSNKLLFKPSQEQSRQIFSTETSFVISHIMSDNNARLLTFGPHNYLNIPGKTVGAKTGTTDDKRDNWTIGFTKDIVIGVWVGNNDNSKMNPALASGVSGAAPIWYRLFNYAFKKGYKDGIMDKPDKVKAVEIDSFFGGLQKEGIPKRVEYYREGTEPKAVSPFYKKLKVSKSGDKLANTVEIGSGNYDEKEFYLVTESDPVSLDGKNRWQEAISKWASEQSDEKWKVPRETSTDNADSISITLTKPLDRSRVGNDIDILARTFSTETLSYFKLLVNDSEKINTKETVIDQRINLSDGIYRLKFVAENSKGKKTEKEILVGVNQDAIPTPTSAPPATPVPTTTAPTPTSVVPAI